MKTAVASEFDLSNMKTLDLRHVHAPERNFRVMQAFASLRPNDEFCIVLDYEPLALKQQFQVEMRGRFDWHEMENGPDIWKILIVKKRRTNGSGR